MMTKPDKEPKPTAAEAPASSPTGDQQSTPRV